MIRSLKAELASLLGESITTAKERERKAFDELIGKDKIEGYLLFGSGGLGRRTLTGLRKLGIEPHGFVDNNASIWNTTVDALNVFSPQDAVRKFPNHVFILTIWSDAIGHPFEEVQAQLNELNKVKVVSFIFLYWKYPEVFLPYFEIDLPHKTLKQAYIIKSAFLLWDDDASCAEFMAQVRLRLYGDSKGLPPPTIGKQYFPVDLFKINPDEVFIDCGAFDGDTFREFLLKSHEEFSRYIAYEPDPDNCRKFKEYLSLLSNSIAGKVSVFQVAVSNQKKTISFEAIGSLQSVIKDDGNISVNCISLDEDLTSVMPTYIKMDAEGAEPEIILGATQLILKHFPILAISVYHQFDHLWKLPLMVNAINPDYKFYLRPHCKAGWDLVCYSVPRYRQ